MITNRFTLFWKRDPSPIRAGRFWAKNRYNRYNGI